jgi:NADH dehydrogenase/NADH:ubiquinone oxidoreductase subunit G
MFAREAAGSPALVARAKNDRLPLAELARELAKRVRRMESKRQRAVRLTLALQLLGFNARRWSQESYKLRGLLADASQKLAEYESALADCVTPAEQAEFLAARRSTTGSASRGRGADAATRQRERQKRLRAAGSAGQDKMKLAVRAEVDALPWEARLTWAGHEVMAHGAELMSELEFLAGEVGAARPGSAREIARAELERCARDLRSLPAFSQLVDSRLHAR